MRRAQAGSGFRLATEGEEPARQLLPTLSAAYKQEHYAANKQRYIAQAAARKRKLAVERTTYLIRFFASHPCEDCGETDPLVLEFDHLGDKAFNVGSALRTETGKASWMRSPSAKSSVRTAIGGARHTAAAPFEQC